MSSAVDKAMAGLILLECGQYVEPRRIGGDGVEPGTIVTCPSCRRVGRVIGRWGQSLDRTPLDNALVSFEGAWDEYERATDARRDAVVGLARAWRFAIEHLDRWARGLDQFP